MKEPGHLCLLGSGSLEFGEWYNFWIQFPLDSVSRGWPAVEAQKSERFRVWTANHQKKEGGKRIGMGGRKEMEEWEVVEEESRENV